MVIPILMKSQSSTLYLLWDFDWGFIKKQIKLWDMNHAPPPLQGQNQCKRTYSKQVLKGSANSSILDRSVPANRLSFAKKAPVNSLITMEFVYCQNIIFLYIIRLLINDFILPI